MLFYDLGPSSHAHYTTARPRGRGKEMALKLAEYFHSILSRLVGKSKQLSATLFMFDLLPARTNSNVPHELLLIITVSHNVCVSLKEQKH